MMSNADTIIEQLLALPEVTQGAHFDKLSFKVSKKIFATFDQPNGLLCLKLSEIDQDVFCKFRREAAYAVPNKWGKQGWTYFKVNDLPQELLANAVKTSYCVVAPKKLVALVKTTEL